MLLYFVHLPPQAGGNVISIVLLCGSAGTSLTVEHVRLDQDQHVRLHMLVLSMWERVL